MAETMPTHTPRMNGFELGSRIMSARHAGIMSFAVAPASARAAFEIKISAIIRAHAMPALITLLSLLTTAHSAHSALAIRGAEQRTVLGRKMRCPALCALWVGASRTLSGRRLTQLTGQPS